ncbi:MAG: hypothetical protein R3B70_03305 [Polyangiaceae bacterium]
MNTLSSAPTLQGESFLPYFLLAFAVLAALCLRGLLARRRAPAPALAAFASQEGISPEALAAACAQAPAGVSALPILDAARALDALRPDAPRVLVFSPESFRASAGLIPDDAGAPPRSWTPRTPSRPLSWELLSRLLRERRRAARDGRTLTELFPEHVATDAGAERRADMLNRAIDRVMEAQLLSMAEAAEGARAAGASVKPGRAVLVTGSGENDASPIAVVLADRSALADSLAATHPAIAIDLRHPLADAPAPVVILGFGGVTIGYVLCTETHPEPAFVGRKEAAAMLADDGAAEVVRVQDAGGEA